MFALRIKENRREQNVGWMEGVDHPHSTSRRYHNAFMREFSPGLFLKRVRVPEEGNHGPGPEFTWATSEMPCQTFPSEREALDYWRTEGEVGDVIPEVVEITFRATRGQDGVK